VSAGASGLTLTVVGFNFLSGAVVRWNDSALATTYVSATQLTATVPANRIAAGAYVTIRVVNPGSGGMSLPLTFTVNNPAPLVTGIAPSRIPARSIGFQLSVNGSGFSGNSEVRWNGTALSTTYVSGSQLTANVSAANLVSAGNASITVLNVSPGGGTSAALVFTIGAAQSEGQNRVTSLNMLTTGMVWDASRGRFYAILPATSVDGNSVVSIDPLTGAATTPVHVGSDPRLLALSADASHLWVSLDGANAIQRLTLPDLAPDLRIEIPPDSQYGPQVAISMQPAPVSPDTVAITTGNGRVAVYKGAVQLPSTVSTWATMDWVQWGPDDGALYGQMGHSVGVELYVMNVDASGVRVDTLYNRVFPDEDSRGYYDRSTGRFYADDGFVFDPSTEVVPGTFNLRDLTTYACVLDPVAPVVFFLGRDASQFSSRAGYTLRTFDKNTFLQIGNLQIPNATGAPLNLIRWGRAGIAFNTKPTDDGEPGAVYFVDGEFVSSSAEPDFTTGTPVDPLPVFTAMTPESATVGNADLVLTISGSDFQSAATVYWNGQPLTTSVHSATELQAVVPASKLTQDGPATVSVANDSLSYAVNSLAFTILPASGSLIARNLSSLDIAWDAHSSRLYAPVWSADPRYANSVVAIDPASGGISRVAGVAPDPTMLRISRDGTLGYTGYASLNLATQFHVPALDSVMSWSLGAGAYNGPLVAMDLQPAPDSAQTVAISLGTPGFSPTNDGLVIFDNAVARPQRPPGGDSTSNLYDTLQWGLTDSVLYAANNETTGFEFYRVGIDSNGATSLSAVPGVLKDFYLTLHFDRGTGYLYMEDGSAIDPGSGSHVGQYDAGGLVVPDSSINRVFFLGQTRAQLGSSDHTVVSYDQSHFTPVSSLTIQNLVGSPVAISRWGTSGLAIVTYNSNWGPVSGPAGMLYILDNPAFVSARQQAQAGVGNLAVGLAWQPGRSAVSSSRSIKRPADSVDKVTRPGPKRATKDPKGRR
jgi:hypothetical protein